MKSRPTKAEREIWLRVLAPSVSDIDHIAACLWKADAEGVGAPASVAERRTRAAFDEQDQDVRDRWRKFARASLRALQGKADD